MATAVAISECSVMKLKKAAVVRLLHEEPSFAELFLAHLLSRNIKFEEDLVDHLFNSSEKRLARVLLLLANFGKEKQPDLVIPKISQETLAGIVGTTRSIKSQLLYEPISQTRIHPLQRWPEDPQFIAEYRAA